MTFNVYFGLKVMETKLAKLSQLHYHVDSHTKPRAKVKIGKGAGQVGFALKELHRGVAHFHGDGQNVIALKGTNPLHAADIKSDIGVLIGKATSDAQFLDREKQVLSILNRTPGDFIMTGHSLGGTIGTHLLATNDTIRDRVKEAHFFNTGYAPAYHKEIRGKVDKLVRAELKDDITHHVVKGDVLSNALLQGSVGSVEVQRPDKALALHTIDNFVD